MNLRFVRAIPFRMVFDGENDPPVEDDKSGGGGGGGGGDGGGNDDKKKKKLAVPLTPEQQEWVNTQLAEERRKGKAANDQLITQLETQKQRASTTEAERKAIEDRIEQLRGEYATKEEQNKKTMEKRLKDEENKRLQAEKEAKEWQDRYTEERIDSDLTSAATDHKAYNVEPVKAVLRPRTRLAPELDTDGKPTGKFISMVKIEKPGQEGKVQILEMRPVEAVKWMTEQPDKYGNLFISGAAGGVGGNNFGNRGGGKKDETPPTDPHEYQEWRKKQKAAGKL